MTFGKDLNSMQCNAGKHYMLHENPGPEYGLINDQGIGYFCSEISNK